MCSSHVVFTSSIFTSKYIQGGGRGRGREGGGGGGRGREGERGGGRGREGEGEGGRDAIHSYILLDTSALARRAHTFVDFTAGFLH